MQSNSSPHPTVSPNRRGARCWVALAACLLLPKLAGAQAESTSAPAEFDPYSNIEEMVVTGTATLEAITQASISTVGFDADDLKALGATDIGKVAEFTPGLQIKSAFGASNPTIFIRGVGLDDARANASSSVAVLNDDVYMNSPAGQLAQMFDTEKVDVLRGPQGTFYGRNASAGAIRILSHKPTGEVGGSLTATYGRFMQRDIEGMVETPIVPDILAIRMAGKWSERNGFTKNRCAEVEARNPTNNRFTGCSPTVLAVGPRPEKWVNNVDNWAARSIMRLTPLANDDVELLWNFHGSQSRALSPQFQTIGTAGTAVDPRTGTGYVDPDNCNDIRLVNRRPVCFGSFKRPESGNPYKGSFYRTQKEKLDLYGSSISANVVFGDFEFKSISAYEWHDREAGLNLDASPVLRLEPLFTDKARQLTQDLQLAWDGGDGFSATVGGFYLYEHLKVFNIFFAGSAFSPLQDQTQRTRYLGVFGHVRWDLREDLWIEGGARLNDERKSFQIRSSTWNGNTGESVPSNDLDERDEAKVTRGSGETTVHYTPTPEVDFYGKYTRGFKGPHFNGAALRSREGIIEPAKPESVDSFEVGVKTQFFDSAVNIDLAAFYYNYKDQQVFVTRSVTDAVVVNALINANDTRVAGLEATYRTTDVIPIAPWIPLTGLRSQFSFAYLYSEYTNFAQIDTREIRDPQNPSNVITLSELRNFSGNQLVSAPEFSFSGDVSYLVDMGRFGTLTPRVDYSWRSKVFFTPDNQARLGDRSRLLLGTRLTWSILEGNIEVAGWVRNVTDSVYRLTAINLIPVFNQIDYVMSEPRTYGITGTFKF